MEVLDSARCIIEYKKKIQILCNHLLCPLVEESSKLHNAFTTNNTYHGHTFAILLRDGPGLVDVLDGTIHIDWDSKTCDSKGLMIGASWALMA